MDATSKARELLLPLLQAMRDDLRSNDPSINVILSDASVGGKHLLGLSCILPNRSPATPDLVEMLIELSCLTSTPMIQGEVSWGEPSGLVKASAFPEAVAFSDAALALTIERLLSLFRILQKEIARGRPQDGDVE